MITKPAELLALMISNGISTTRTALPIICIGLALAGAQESRAQNLANEDSFRLSMQFSDEEIAAFEEAGRVRAIGIPSEGSLRTPCENDFKDYTCYAPTEPCADAPKTTRGTGVVRLLTFTRDANRVIHPWQGTGFLIEYSQRRDLVMTARHVFEPGTGGPDGIPAGHTLVAVVAQFFYDYPATCTGPGACGTPVASCQKPTNVWACAVKADATCDWGIIKLRGGAPVGAATLPLVNEAFADAKDLDPAYIIQHPDGRCKEVDGDTFQTGDVDIAKDRVGDPCLLDHDVDTEFGSSGSPVLLGMGETDRDKVIGVHVLSGCILNSPEPTYNSATRMSKILGDPLDAAVAAVDGGGRGACALQQGIPTASEWGLIVMTVLVMTAGTIVFGWRRRRAA